jgi:hypothetical protein
MSDPLEVGDNSKKMASVDHTSSVTEDWSSAGLQV